MISALIPIFFGVLLLGIPIFAALAMAVFLTLQFFGNIDPVIVPMRMFTGVNNFALMAIPFFILAAELMRVGGLSNRLIELAKSLVGWVPGGLAAATVLACLFFGSISGSSPATVVAVGAIMFPALVAAGYDKRFAVGLIATAGTLGPIVPPSISFIIYGSVTGTSVGRLFAAGLIPSLLVAAVLIAYCIVYASFKKYERSPFPSLREIYTAFKESLWGLGLPVVLLGGIYSGIFTPTEAAAVACMYGLFVGAVIYRSISLRDLALTLRSAGLMSATLLLITAAASAFSWILSVGGAPAQLANYMLSLSDNSVVVTALLNLVMLVAGFVLDGASATIVLAPLLLPIAQKVGIDPVHFGVITAVNFSVGMITPPVGLNLFVAMAISKMSLPDIFRGTLPFIGMMLIALIIISYVPWMSTWLPSLLY